MLIIEKDPYIFRLLSSFKILYQVVKSSSGHEIETLHYKETFLDDMLYRKSTNITGFYAKSPKTKTEKKYWLCYLDEKPWIFKIFPIDKSEKPIFFNFYKREWKG